MRVEHRRLLLSTAVALGVALVAGSAADAQPLGTSLSLSPTGPRYRSAPPDFAIAQQAGRYYAETGHTLDGLFVEFYDRRGGSELLGFPITESFVDPHSGLLIQYLENARLELAPTGLDAAARVRLAQLGILVGGWDLPLRSGRIPIGRSAGCRYYEQSGHQVCHAFLDFYQRHGGPETFGLPITEFRIEDDRVVQYFETFRLDWNPESGSETRIRVGSLGRVHFEQMRYSAALLSPVAPGELDQYRVLGLRLNASVLKPLVSVGDTQSVYIAVSDQNFRPVEGAATLLTVHLPDATRFQMLPLTDHNGVTRAELNLSDQLPGTRVALEYTVVYRDLSALTRDSFYIWW